MRMHLPRSLLCKLIVHCLPCLNLHMRCMMRYICKERSILVLLHEPARSPRNLIDTLRIVRSLELSRTRWRCIFIDVESLSRRQHLIGRSQMPLAEHPRRISRRLQRLCNRYVIRRKYLTVRDRLKTHLVHGPALRIVHSIHAMPRGILP